MSIHELSEMVELTAERRCIAVESELNPTIK
jgi:hypothetical protein